MGLIQSKFKEVIYSVLPITLLVVVLHFTLTPLETDMMLRFLIGAALIIVGLTIFLTGVDVGITPIGNMMGGSLAKSNRILIVVIVGLLLGFFISVAEPDLHILAGQVGSSEQGTKLLVASLITFPAGRWLTGTAGIALAAISLIILVQTFRADFVEDCKLWEMSVEEQRWITHFGRAGNVGRSLVFAVTGIFLFQAAWTYNSQQAGDLGDSLKALAAQPYGPWVLAAVGVGLIAYGAYALGMAAYRRIAVRKNDYPDSPER